MKKIFSDILEVLSPNKWDIPNKKEETEIERLKKENAELKKQLQPFLYAAQKRKEFIKKRDKIDLEIAQMFCNIYNQQNNHNEKSGI
jgi:hypothetical protein